MKNKEIFSLKIKKTLDKKTYLLSTETAKWILISPTKFYLLQ